MERHDEERARIWKDLLIKALDANDHETFEERWTKGRAAYLWLALGYSRIEDFCRVELERDFEEILGMLSTNDLGGVQK